MFSSLDSSIDSDGKALSEHKALRRALIAPDTRFHRLARFVHENLEHPLSLGQAADVVGLERTYFSRAFRKSVGCTFSEWIRFVRIERAAACQPRPRLPAHVQLVWASHIQWSYLD